MPDTAPGRGFFGWLGRQIGYVKKAVQNDVASKRIYRAQTIEEQPLPHDPSVKLRRTTIDEVIVTEPNDGKPRVEHP